MPSTRPQPGRNRSGTGTQARCISGGHGGRWRRACAENVDHPRARELFDRHRLPAFHDPFAGGGALPSFRPLDRPRADGRAHGLGPRGPLVAQQPSPNPTAVPSRGRLGGRRRRRGKLAWVEVALTVEVVCDRRRSGAGIARPGRLRTPRDHSRDGQRQHQQPKRSHVVSPVARFDEQTPSFHRSVFRWGWPHSIASSPKSP